MEMKGKALPRCGVYIPACWRTCWFKVLDMELRTKVAIAVQIGGLWEVEAVLLLRWSAGWGYMIWDKLKEMEKSGRARVQERTARAARGEKWKRRQVTPDDELQCAIRGSG
jgi:hypothetical protein